MTAQASELLIYKNKEYAMAEEPLEQYLSNMSEAPIFVSPNTSCWRGYFGKWKIKKDRLYLIDLKAYREEGEVVGVEFIFPGQSEVFAEWYSGEIRVPIGEMLEYVHVGYFSVFEEDMFLEIDKGVLKHIRMVDNRNEL